MTLPKQLKHPFLSGGTISLLGTLPFGVLNILAFTIAGRESVVDALLFTLGVVLSEMMIVALCLKWIGSFRLKPVLFDLLQLAMAGFILFLAVRQILQIGTIHTERTDLLSSDWPRFFLGLFLSAINPSQFPFWISWNGILKNNGSLENRKNRIHYVFGIGTGTFCGLLCFICASQYVSTSSHFFASAGYYLVMSGIFAVTGGLMLFKFLQKRLKAHRLNG